MVILYGQISVSILKTENVVYTKKNHINVKNIFVKEKKYNDEDPEYGVDSRYTSEEERKIDSVNLMEARILRLKKLSKTVIAYARQLQQKLKNGTQESRENV